MIAEKAGVEDNRVVIGQGSLLLQDFLARTLLKPGDLAYVETPTYDRTITTLRRPGAKVMGFTVEADGINVDLLEKRLRQGEKPALLYLIPDFQNPTGTVISLEKRKKIVDLAEFYGFWIIEDVPYRILRYRGSDIPSMFDLAPQRVIQMSSYSKQIGPGLRVGYVILPTSLACGFLNLVEEAYICPTYLTQAMVYEFINQGWLDENIKKLKELYPPRLDALLTSLDEKMSDLATWFKPDGGFFVGLNVKGQISQAELLKQARAAGLILTDGRLFYPDSSGENFIRLPFCALTPDEIREGVGRLASVVRGLTQYS